jgi:hypothetical protein
MTEFIYWFVPLVIFMLSPALLPIGVHICGHFYDKVRPRAQSQAATMSRGSGKEFARIAVRRSSRGEDSCDPAGSLMTCSGGLRGGLEPTAVVLVIRPSGEAGCTPRLSSP